MTNTNTQPAAHDQSTGDLFGGAESLPSIVHSALRGRLLKTVLLGAALAAPLALLGFLSTKPMYEGAGTVYIKNERNVTVNETHLSKPVGYYHDFVQAERERLRGGTVYQQAAQDPQLQAIGWPQGDAGRRELQRIIRVPATYNGNIEIQASNPRAQAVKEAVNAVLRAYMVEQGASLKTRADGMLNPLLAQESDSKARLAALQADALPLFDQYGTPETVNDEIKSINEELVKLAGELRNHPLAIEQMDADIARRSETLAARRSGDTSAGPTRKQLAFNDTKLENLEDQLSVVKAQLTRSINNGLLASHPSVVRMQEQVTLIDGLITDRLGVIEARWWSAYEANIDTKITQRAAALKGVAELEKQKTRAAERRQVMLAQLAQIKEATQAISAEQDKLHLVVGRREALEAEIAAGQNNEQLYLAEVIQWAELPGKHASDSRLLRAIAGAIFGLMLAIGGMVAFAQLNRRVRYIDELGHKQMGVPCLGVIPLLSGGADADALEVYEMIDHARGLLELGDAVNGDRRVLTVTSAGAGDGKSTLARALASSFARAGQRTLLIDADPHGRSASRRMGADRKVGLAEALASPEVAGIVDTSIDGLWLMPAGGGGGAASFAQVERLIEDLRNDFDRIIVDTGPIFGSVEANLMSRVADGTVLVVSHGQPRNQVDRALERIREIGATCAGMVFNRAEQGDYIKSASPTSAGARRDDLYASDRPVDARSNGSAGRKRVPGMAGAYS